MRPNARPSARSCAHERASTRIASELVMRFAHVADLHIGKSLNRFPLIADQRHILGQIVEIAQAQQADALVIAGDVYDRAAPAAEAMALLDEFFMQVADVGLTCIVIPGNHDSAVRLAYAQTALARHGIHIAPVFDGSISPIVLEDAHGPIAFWPFPFLKPSQVAHFLPDAHIDGDYSLAMAAVVAASEPDFSMRNVAVAHQFVTHGNADPIRSDSELSIGGLDRVDAAVFDGFDYVALGHIHTPQTVGSDTIRYAGSPLAYSFSEVDVPKSVSIVDVGAKGSVAIACAPLHPLHEMRQVEGPLAQLVADEVADAAPRDDYLRIILTDPDPIPDAMTRIRTVYPNAMSVEYKSQGDGALPAPAAPHPQATPLQMFEEFFEGQTGRVLDEEQRALAASTLAEAFGEASARETGCP